MAKVRTTVAPKTAKQIKVAKFLADRSAAALAREGGKPATTQAQLKAHRKQTQKPTVPLSASQKAAARREKLTPNFLGPLGEALTGKPKKKR
jgi:hypothetical protein